MTLLNNLHLLNLALALLIVALILAACSLKPSEGYGFTRCAKAGDWSADAYCTAVANDYRM